MDGDGHGQAHEDQTNEDQAIAFRSEKPLCLSHIQSIVLPIVDSLVRPHDNKLYESSISHLSSGSSAKNLCLENLSRRCRTLSISIRVFRSRAVDDSRMLRDTAGSHTWSEYSTTHPSSPMKSLSESATSRHVV